MDKNNQSETPLQKCSNCGAPVRPDSPEQLCPACLLANVINPAAETWPGGDVSAETCHAGEALKAPSDEFSTERIGRYKLLQKIGEGGCGVVYMAEQEEPVRRRVALKVIKLGMDTKQVIARFEAERQALAMMDHPNIAKVFDAGATETGRPYFVMELVKGVRITDYCDQNKLSTRQRLELFKQVCHAIQHAHQKGIIHRDIKPSNILVTLHDGVPVPKVIDFGIAKATDQQLTDKTVFTAFGQFIGTPAYMSPEQAGLASFDVDTRSDVYSLGVLLYELLTGHTPFDARKLLEIGYDAVMRTVREEEPQKPSTRLSTLQQDELTAIATKRHAAPADLNRLVRGELDWIVMKALEKDRTRRYATANGLARDLEHHLNGEPISVAPPSFVYQAGKFLRKHRAVAPVAVVVALLLVAATAWTTQWMATRPKPFVRAGEPLLATLRSHDKEIKALAYSPKRKLLATASSDGTTKLWAADTGALLATLRDTQRPPLRGNEKWVKALAFTPDGNTLASMASEGKLLLWNTATKKLRRVFSEEERFAYSSISFTPDGKTLMAVDHDARSVSFWDLATSRRISSIKPDGASINRASLSPDGETLAITAGGMLGLWDVVSQRQLWWRRGDAREIVSFVFSPDGKMLATGGADHFVRLWDLSAGRVITTLPELHGSWVWSVAFSPDGKYLASDNQGPILIWDVASRRKVAVLQGPVSFTHGLLFYGDGLLASASDDRDLKIWDARAAIGTLLGRKTLEEFTRELSPRVHRDGLVSGRYVKLLSEKVDGINHAAIAELNFLDGNGALIPQPELSIHSASSFQTPVESEPARNPEYVLDGELGSFWHSQWSPGPGASFPHWIVIDLGKPRNLGAFLLKNRTDGKRHADILKWRFYVSDDAESWKEVGNGTFDNNPEWQGYAFPKPDVRNRFQK